MKMLTKALLSALSVAAAAFAASYQMNPAASLRAHGAAVLAAVSAYVTGLLQIGPRRLKG